MSELPFAEAAAAIRGAGRLLAVGHLAPDGDAVGSALGFAVAARRAGIEAWASFGEPLELPRSLSHLPIDLITPSSDLPHDVDVAVVFDTASAERLGSTGDAVAAADRLVVVDHHASNTGFGDIVVIDPTAGSSAELAYLLLRELDWRLDPVVATCLYTGIVTDTGRFQYSSTSSRTLRIAADLLDCGVRPEEIGQNLYEKVPFGYLALAAGVLDRAELDEERSFIWSVMFLDDLATAGVGYADSDPLIDDLRIAEEAGAALLMKEIDGGFKCSLRSRGVVDVGTIAVALGGGGHHNASGFTHRGPPAAIADEIRRHIDEQQR